MLLEDVAKILTTQLLQMMIPVGARDMIQLRIRGAA
jgi:hypothetical protein